MPAENYWWIIWEGFQIIVTCSITCQKFLGNYFSAISGNLNFKIITCLEFLATIRVIGMKMWMWLEWLANRSPVNLYSESWRYEWLCEFGVLGAQRNREWTPKNLRKQHVKGEKWIVATKLWTYFRNYFVSGRIALLKRSYAVVSFDIRQRLQQEFWSWSGPHLEGEHEFQQIMEEGEDMRRTHRISELEDTALNLHSPVGVGHTDPDQTHLSLHSHTGEKASHTGTNTAKCLSFRWRWLPLWLAQTRLCRPENTQNAKIGPKLVKSWFWGIARRKAHPQIYSCASK